MVRDVCTFASLARFQRVEYYEQVCYIIQPCPGLIDMTFVSCIFMYIRKGVVQHMLYLFCACADCDWVWSQCGGLVACNVNMPLIMRASASEHGFSHPARVLLELKSIRVQLTLRKIAVTI